MDFEENYPIAEIESLKEGREGGSTIPGCRLVLSDGSSYFILLSDSDRFGCRAGKEVDRSFREQLRRAHSRWEICSKALALIARREHARQELRLKLEKRFLYPSAAYSPGRSAGYRGDMAEIIGEVLTLLESRGFINDERFAEAWSASRLRKHPEGRSALLVGLRSRGVSGEIAGRIADELEVEGAFSSALERACIKLSGRQGGDREKLIRKIMARGFSYRDVKNWLLDNPELFPEEKSEFSD